MFRSDKEREKVKLRHTFCVKNTSVFMLTSKQQRDKHRLLTQCWRSPIGIESMMVKLLHFRRHFLADEAGTAAWSSITQPDALCSLFTPSSPAGPELTLWEPAAGGFPPVFSTEMPLSGNKVSRSNLPLYKCRPCLDCPLFCQPVQPLH